jgi:SAM-dependent methyltransferase
MSSESSGPTVDFSALEFDKLWLGRHRTTAVERAVLRTALARTDRRRVLEVGVGEGRLTPVTREDSAEFVAVDLTPTFLARMPWEPRPNAIRVAANVNSLPFADHAFTAIVMARLYNFLDDPGRTLREIRRVLLPGGHLILSYSPKPSLATFVDDLKLWRAGEEKFGSATFSREDVVPVRPSSFPAWAPTRARFQRTLEQEQFLLLREFPTGFEDFRPFGRLPVEFFIQLAAGFQGLGGFPNRLAVARSRAGPSPALPEWSAIWACPRCGRPFRLPEGGSPALSSCAECHLPLRLEDGIVEARHPAPVIPEPQPH